MYAIVDVKDKQFKVQESDTLYVPYHADAEVDDTLTLDRVLLLSDGEGDVTLGTPTVEDASVIARVVDQVKGDKVLVFKKKRRKRYRVKRGHRQQYTQIEITALHTGNGTPAAEATLDEAVAEPEEEPAETTASEDTEAAVEETETEATAVEDSEDPDATEETATEDGESKKASAEAVADEAPADEATAETEEDVSEDDEETTAEEDVSEEEDEKSEK